MICEQDGAYASLLRIVKHFKKGAAGMGRIFGVGMQDATVIAEVGEERNVAPPGVQLLDVVMHGGQPN